MFEGFAVEQPTETPVETEKRGRGRPKKEVLEIEEPQGEKRGRGRPKKLTEEPDENQAEKRGRGRPKKETPEQQIQEPVERRGRGRPKKEVVEEVASTEKRSRGRPKKSVASAEKPVVAGEFDSLMAPQANPELDELEKLNAKIESENKRLAEHQEELNNQLTETLFHLSNDDD